MTRVRHDLAAAASKPASTSKTSKSASSEGLTQSQKIKGVVAVIALIAAGILIAYQAGAFNRTWKPEGPDQPLAERDPVAPPPAGAPVREQDPEPTSGFTRYAKPVQPR